METISAAAIKAGDLVISVPQPGRHHHVLHEMDRLGLDAIVHGKLQGFITSSGRFVDREEGCRLAEAAGQIRHKTGPADVLFSECMW